MDAARQPDKALATRVVSAVVLAVLLFAALAWLPAWGWALFTLVVLTIAAWEWSGFARLPARARIAMATALAIACLAAAVWTGLADGAAHVHRAVGFYLLAAAFWLLAAPTWLVRNPSRPASILIIAAAFAVLVPAYLAMLDLRRLGAGVFLMIAAIVWTADIAAYFAGKRFGRHKLAPAISPGKTWEGVGGALVAVALYTLAVSDPLREALGARSPLGLLCLVALALAALSIVGDLFESALKRQAGLKDSSQIVPGHGGLLDRIDALMPVLPLAALVASWVVDRA